MLITLALEDFMLECLFRNISLNWKSQEIWGQQDSGQEMLTKPVAVRAAPETNMELGESQLLQIVLSPA